MAESIADVLFPEEAVAHVEAVVESVLSPVREDRVDGRKVVGGKCSLAEVEGLVRVKAGAALHIRGVTAEPPARVAESAPAAMNEALRAAASDVAPCPVAARGARASDSAACAMARTNGINSCKTVV